MKYYLLACFLILAFPVFNMELTRFQECLHACWERNMANEELVNSKICRNFRLRLKHASTGNLNCEKADKELQISPVQCAYKMWVQNAELIRLYNSVAGSYWRIVGIVLPLAMFCLYLMAKLYGEKKSDERMYKQQEKFVRKILPKIKAPLNSVQIEEMEEHDTELTFTL